MDFAASVGSGFKNYGNFRGMATRSEFWYWVLFTVLVSAATWTIDQALGGTTVPALDPALDTGNADLNYAIAMLNKPTVASNIASIILLLPTLSVTARRFHDAGFSGKWQWLQVIPFIFTFVGLIALTVTVGLQPETTGFDIEMAMGALVVIGFATVTAIGYFVFQLVLTLRKTRTEADGNKYAVKYADTVKAPGEPEAGSAQ
ncbi:MAG: hypothetical protein RL431_2 [Actinomycetota bacterium]|jgi:uncharacterized membrane protein YhaH (DUF805 family)